MNHRDKSLAPRSKYHETLIPPRFRVTSSNARVHVLSLTYMRARTQLVNLPELIPTSLPQTRRCEAAGHRNNLLISISTSTQRTRCFATTSRAAFVTVTSWDGSPGQPSTARLDVLNGPASRASCRPQQVCEGPAALSLYIPLFLTRRRAYAKPHSGSVPEPRGNGLSFLRKNLTLASSAFTPQSRSVENTRSHSDYEHQSFFF